MNHCMLYFNDRKGNSQILVVNVVSRGGKLVKDRKIRDSKSNNHH